MIMIAMMTRQQHKEKWQPAGTDKRQKATITTTMMLWSSSPLTGGEERQRGEKGSADNGDDNNGDNNDGENDDQKINSKYTFCPSQSRKGTGSYSTCVLGIRLRYRCHGLHMVKELKWG
jgi:hypothetical protein